MSKGRNFYQVINVQCLYAEDVLNEINSAINKIRRHDNNIFSDPKRILEIYF
jgi:hypothetical protein